MSLRPLPAKRVSDPALERRQREHELTGALEAARTFQSRLEMLGDHPGDVRSVRGIRDNLAGELASLLPPDYETQRYDDEVRLKTFLKPKSAQVEAAR